MRVSVRLCVKKSDYGREGSRVGVLRRSLSFVLAQLGVLRASLGTPLSRSACVLVSLSLVLTCSLLCMRKRVNLWQRISSISSACLMLMETRTEFTDGSIRQRSCSVLQIVIGLRRSSLDARVSTSGLLWRSTVWEGKLRMQEPASRVDLTQFRYGRSVFA